jgi:hypothetical protein
MNSFSRNPSSARRCNPLESSFPTTGLIEDTMHITSGRWVFGLLLALLTALLWGILPIKLKQVLQVMDPITVTWYRLRCPVGCCSPGWRPATPAFVRRKAARANCWCWSPSAA